LFAGRVDGSLVENNIASYRNDTALSSTGVGNLFMLEGRINLAVIK
jgi:hypothetical protein